MSNYDVKSDSCDKRVSMLEKELSEQIAFQKRWQVLAMSAYVISSIGLILCTVAATFLASVGDSFNAAILSAVSTVLVGTEKALLFREKWQFHLAMRSRLSSLRIKLRMGNISPDEATIAYATALELYPRNLPISRPNDRTRKEE